MLTQMSETIVCVSADLTADIAYEFYNFLSPDCRLKLGTDDIASAYRVLLSASPQYNVAAVWRPRAADGLWAAEPCRRRSRRTNTDSEENIFDCSLLLRRM